jgi:antitoxin CcdA
MPETIDRLVDPKLISEAESLGIDVKQELASHLRARIDTRKREIAWREENREAIQSWNEWTERNGLWYENLRTK